MKRALITGVSGFVGRYMSAELAANGYEVYGLIRARSRVDGMWQNFYRPAFICGDITDLASMESCIQEVKPNCVFHLAAQSFVPASWNAPEATMQANVIGTMNVLEAVRKYAPECIVHVCGSSEEYGFVDPAETPIKETNPLRPLSPYGVSKVASDMLGYQYAKSYGLRVVRTRAFNHTGPGRGAQFVTTTICRQAAEIARKKRECFELGNCDAIRDFTDVRDTVRAYRLLVEDVESGIIESGDLFNIATNKGYSIKQVVDIASICAGVKSVIKHDESKMRPSDVPILIGDYRKIKISGWKPRIRLEQTISDMVKWQMESE